MSDSNISYFIVFTDFIRFSFGLHELSIVRVAGVARLSGASGRVLTFSEGKSGEQVWLNFLRHSLRAG